MNDCKGNSFANGASVNNGPVSPYWAQRLQGWDIRPLYTLYDFAGRDPS